MSKFYEVNSSQFNFSPDVWYHLKHWHLKTPGKYDISDHVCLCIFFKTYDSCISATLLKHTALNVRQFVVQQSLKLVKILYIYWHILILQQIVLIHMCRIYGCPKVSNTYNFLRAVRSLNKLEPNKVIWLPCKRLKNNIGRMYVCIFVAVFINTNIFKLKQLAIGIEEQLFKNQFKYCTYFNIFFFL